MTCNWLFLPFWACLRRFRSQGQGCSGRFGLDFGDLGMLEGEKGEEGWGLLEILGMSDF